MNQATQHRCHMFLLAALSLSFSCASQVATGSMEKAGITAGWLHTMALKSDGTVWAWGWNGDGELGDGTTTSRLTPVQTTGLSGVIAIAGGQSYLCGGDHSLALKADGTVWAWGYNASGELGDGTTTSRLSPVQATGLNGIVAIAAGAMHSLALKSDGTVWGWGENYSGQVGDGTTTDRLSPVQLSAMPLRKWNSCKQRD